MGSPSRTAACVHVSTWVVAGADGPLEALFVYSMPLLILVRCSSSGCSAPHVLRRSVQIINICVHGFPCMGTMFDSVLPCCASLAGSKQARIDMPRDGEAAAVYQSTPLFPPSFHLAMAQADQVGHALGRMPSVLVDCGPHLMLDAMRMPEHLGGGQRVSESRQRRRGMGLRLPCSIGFRLINPGAAKAAVSRWPRVLKCPVPLPFHHNPQFLGTCHGHGETPGCRASRASCTAPGPDQL